MTARAVAAFIVVGLTASLALATCTTSREVPDEVPEGLEPIWETWRALQGNFVDKERVTSDAVNEAAIRGILESLEDPYASYLAPLLYEIEADFSGEFEGIGAEVTVRDGQLVIVAPIPGSPASQSGLRPGDVILAVDGVGLEDKTLLEAVSLVRGPKGSSVRLLIFHEGAAAPIEVTVVRDTIVVVSVNGRLLEPDIGYVQLSHFKDPATEELQETLERLRREGMEGLVLDLRNNPGGTLEAAIGVASQFLDEGLVLYAINADDERVEWQVEPDGVALDIPMVVLVNGFSASASEVVTGALQDGGRATVVGATTFGKGSVNQFTSLSNGGGLYFTIARWFTPEGRQIEGAGLEPDVVAGESGEGRATRRLRRLVLPLCRAYQEAKEDLRGSEGLVKALEELCASSVPTVDGGLEVDRDAQLERAVAVLKGRMG